MRIYSVLMCCCCVLSMRDPSVCFMSVFFSFLFHFVIIFDAAAVVGIRWRSSLGNRHALRASNIMHFSSFFSPALTASPSHFYLFLFHWFEWCFLILLLLLLHSGTTTHTAFSSLASSALLLVPFLLLLLLCLFLFLPFWSWLSFHHIAYSVFCSSAALLFHLPSSEYTIFILFPYWKRVKEKELKNKLKITKAIRYCCLVLWTISLCYCWNFQMQRNHQHRHHRLNSPVVRVFPEGYFESFDIYLYKYQKHFYTFWFDQKLKNLFIFKLFGEYWWRS